MDFTYIIGYKHSPDRIDNLKRIIDWISKTGCEVIIVEQDTESKISEIEGVKKVLLQNNYPFNKSWCFNFAWKQASNNKIVFGDADLIMDMDSLLESVSKLGEYECINPYSSVIDLFPEETLSSKTFEDLKKISRPGRGETDHQKVPMCGGIILFTKDSLEKVGGWCEDFWGWGAEDDFMSIKSKMFLNYLEVKNVCYHLYHIRGMIDQNLYYRNLHVYNELGKLGKDQMSNYIQIVKDKIGLPVKT